jgi:hypothetical protein
MKLQTLWRRAVQTITQETEQDLGLRLLEVEAGIAAGTGDVAALLQQGRELKDRMTALRLRTQGEEQAAYTARVQAEAEAIRAEYEPEFAKLFKLIGELLLVHGGLAVLHQKHPEAWGLHSKGLPPHFTGELVRGINALTGPGLEWDLDGAGPVPRGMRIVAPMRDLRGNYVHHGAELAVLQ